MESNTSKTLTVAMSQEEIEKSVMAELALLVAGQRNDEGGLLNTRCAMQEIVAMKMREGCQRVRSMLAGYGARMDEDGDIMSISLELPVEMSGSCCMSLGERMERYVCKWVLGEVMKSVPGVEVEMRKCEDALREAEGGMKRLTAALLR